MKIASNIPLAFLILTFLMSQSVVAGTSKQINKSGKRTPSSSSKNYILIDQTECTLGNDRKVTIISYVEYLSTKSEDERKLLHSSGMMDIPDAIEITRAFSTKMTDPKARPYQFKFVENNQFKEFCSPRDVWVRNTLGPTANEISIHWLGGFKDDNSKKCNDTPPTYEIRSGGSVIAKGTANCSRRYIPNEEP